MITPQDIYVPLYTNKDRFIYLITGGRASGKSFNVGTYIERLTFDCNSVEGRKNFHKILYTRYTMTSAHISIIPELWEKIELDGTKKYFKRTKTDIYNKLTGASILFRGIKTSSGNQTAKLKSIQGVTTFVVDEAEEWVSETDFDKMVLSIRRKGIQNRVIVIMNPTDSNHFIYDRYIKNTHEIRYIDGVPVQISTHPNVLHIHTTYHDNIDNLSEEFLKEVKEIKETNKEKYAHSIIGRWADVAEGAVFKHISQVEKIPDWVKKRGIGIDYGYSQDPTAIVDCAVHEDTLYLDLICYKTHMLTRDIIAELSPYKSFRIISESADPRLIQEIANAGYQIKPVEKSPGSILSGIAKMKEYNICVTKRSYQMLEEFRKYVYDKDNDGNYTNLPIDAYNHAIDASRYWVLGEILGKIQKPSIARNKPDWMI